MLAFGAWAGPTSIAGVALLSGITHVSLVAHLSCISHIPAVSLPSGGACVTAVASLACIPGFSLHSHLSLHSLLSGLPLRAIVSLGVPVVPALLVWVRVLLVVVLSGNQRRAAGPRLDRHQNTVLFSLSSPPRFS